MGGKSPCPTSIIKRKKEANTLFDKHPEEILFEILNLSRKWYQNETYNFFMTFYRTTVHHSNSHQSKILGSREKMITKSIAIY